MSVQLVVYPQWYKDGTPVAPPAGAQQMIANPFNFTMNSTGHTVNASQLSQTVIDALFPIMIPSKWYGYYKNGAGGVTGGNNTLALQQVASGVFQRLSGMIVGATYDVKITWNSSYAREVMLKIYDGDTLVSVQSATPPSPPYEVTIQITPPSVNDTVLNIDYNDDTTYTIISSISCKLATTTSPNPIIGLNNGSVIVDLYEDEDIPMTFSVDNFKNAAEKVQSYSKAFNLPATKRNNLIFDNVFEITRVVDNKSIHFNPLKRTKAVLKQDGIVLFEGYLRMLDISEKDGELSYNVNLYAEVTALADTLKDRTFQDLGFEELEHDYNRTEIRNSWNTSGAGINYTNSGTSGFRDDHDTLKYPFCDWNHQFVVSDGLTNTQGDPQLTNLEQAFRPWLQLKYLIDRIFAASEFTYTSNFFNTSIFKKLYMDFNWGESNYGAAPIRNDECRRKSNLSDYNIAESPSWTTMQLVLDDGTSNNDLWDSTNNRFVSDVPNLQCTVNYRIQIMNEPFPNVDDWSSTLRVCKFNQFGVVLETFYTEKVETPPGGSDSIYGSFSTTLQNTEYIELQAQTYNDEGDIEASDGTTSYMHVTYNNEAAQVYTLLNSARADINQWEFLKGIMTMFNLIAIPDPDDINNLIIETYENIFIKTSNNNSESLADRGITHDWTEQVDYSTIKTEPLADLNKSTIFRYAEDEEDYAFSIYKRDVNGYLYGSQKIDAADLTLLTGKKEVVAEPFAATVIKPLMSQYKDFVIPSIYAMNDEGGSEGFANSPRIMYDTGVTTLNDTDYYLPAQNGVGDDTRTSYLEFSHISDTPPVTTDIDFNFGACALMPDNWNPVANNLFNMYWLPYYSELYNSNTRVVTVKINLSSGDINTFKFNDQVMIKNRAYRVNKIDYKPNDFATVELILLNYI
jgi:hypothetical protein